jgi:outer membrane protein assembly factor BamD
MKKTILLITGLIFVLMLSGCASDKTVQDVGAAYKGKTEKQIYIEGEQNLLDGNYSQSTKAFEALDTLFPFGRYAQKGQLDIIYAYYKNGDVPSTLAASDRYIHLYPMGPHVDYAYYMRGLAEFYENQSVLDQYFNTDYAQRELGPLRKSFYDFSELVYRFPKSKYTPDARKRMVFIRNVMARNELETGVFYYDRQAYVAAANRANNVVRHYQGSTSVPGALVLMTESYTKVKDFKDAEQALNVLKLNYPNNESIPHLQRDIQRAEYKDQHTTNRKKA